MCGALFRTVPLEGAELRRVTVAELETDPYLMSGAEPFVLSGAMDGWGALEKFQDLSFFTSQFPDAIVDYYPQNLDQTNKKPFLVPFSTFAKEGWFEADVEVPDDRFAERYLHSRYIHWRLHLPEFLNLKRQKVFGDLPDFMKVDGVWMKKCFPPRKTGRSGPARDHEEWPLDNFFRHAHWRIIVIGQKNSSMFLHGDGFQTATFVAQFVGRKRWIVCPPSTSHNLYGAGKLDLFHPTRIDYKTYPKARHGVKDCTDTVVHPGDIVYYPAHWWHQTLNLDTPTISMAGRRIDAWNFEEVRDELTRRCGSHQEDISKKWPGAAPPLSGRVCKHVRRCAKIWGMLWDTPLTFVDAAAERHGKIMSYEKDWA